MRPAAGHLHVAPAHPDAASPLLVWAARAFAALGAEVVIADGDDNLIRSRRPADPGSLPFVVVAAGLPNLMHELAHAVQAGRLADDHGFDYSRIPLDVADASLRALLWDELACAAISCAYGEPGEVDAWFKEQVEIQGVFYGREDGEDFASFVEATRARHPGELEARVAAAYAAVEAALVGAGAPPEVARPERLSFAGLWARYRAWTRANSAACPFPA